MAGEFELKALITGVDKLSPALKGIQKNIKGWQRSLKSSAEGAPAIGAGLAAGAGVALAAFAKSEDAAIGLKVSMMEAGGIVPKQFEKINKLAVGLGNKLPGTTADFQNMMTMLQRQGIATENILGGVGEATAYLAVQLKKPPEAAAEFAAKMQDATGTAAKDMMGLFDTIQKAFYMGVDDGNMLSFFSRTGSILKMVDKDGLKAAQALAPITVMMDQMGIAAEASGNALRKVFTAGFDRKKMKEANKELRKHKIRLDFTDGKGEFGGLDNMFKQLEKLKGLTSADRNTILGKIFGTEDGVSQVVNALIDKGKAGYDDVVARMEKQANLQTRVEAQLGSMQNMWDAMTGTAVNGLAAIGGAFQSDAKGVISGLAVMAENFQSFAAANPNVIRGVAGLIAGFAALKIGALGVSMAMGVMSSVISLSPVGLLIRGIALAAGLIIGNWSTIGPWFKDMWAGVSGWFSSAWATITDVCATGWGFIKDLLFNFVPLGIVIKNWEPLVAWFKNLFERIRPYIEPVMSGARWLGDKASGFSDAASSAWSSAKGTASGLWDGATSFFSSDKTTTAKQADANAAAKAAGRSELNGEMVVRFDNAPPGMSVVKSDTNSRGFNLNSDVGYNRFAFN